MKPPTKFTSVHDYLDQCFPDQHPTQAQIQHARKVYWRAYNTDLKTRQRKKHKILQISFSKEEYQLLQNCTHKNQKLYQYAKQLLLQQLESDRLQITFQDTAVIEQQLFMINDYLEQLLDYPNISTDQLSVLERKIHHLEMLITQPT